MCFLSTLSFLQDGNFVGARFCLSERAMVKGNGYGKQNVRKHLPFIMAKRDSIIDRKGHFFVFRKEKGKKNEKNFRWVLTDSKFCCIIMTE